MPLGRLDGKVSSASDTSSLPSPLESIATHRQKFASKGLNDHDLVTLAGTYIYNIFCNFSRNMNKTEFNLQPTNKNCTHAGAHTIGQTDCRFFQYRLYNFTTTGNADPTMSASFLTQIQSQCPKAGDGLNRVALDKDTPAKFDVSFFKNVRDGNAVLESDQRLWSDAVTGPIVKNYAGSLRGLLGLRFDVDFPKAMVKMSSIGVKNGSDGEIRSVCSSFN